MKTIHKFLTADSRKKFLKANSLNLVLTSPPYPMIQMWDEIFASMNSQINMDDPEKSFELMHLELKKVYKQAFKTLKEGGFLIVNIGDATRSFDGEFSLFPNCSKTIEICRKIGFTMLPQIHWWKPTNSPNKFMGSGMYPAGAYVTLENEHILIFRKGSKRVFSNEEKIIRQKSGYFQNERNLWFSDIWTNVVGTKQKISNVGRERNGAYPFELAYRLINMYSIQGDVVWDPFAGTGTTSIAAIVSQRSSIMNDIDPSFVKFALKRGTNIKIPIVNKNQLLRSQVASKEAKLKLKKKNIKPKYKNKNYGIVYTSQEQKIQLPILKEIKKISSELLEASYE